MLAASLEACRLVVGSLAPGAAVLEPSWACELVLSTLAWSAGLHHWGVEPRVVPGAEVGEPVAKPLGVEPREETGAAVGLPVAETLGVEPREAVVAVAVPVVEMLGVEPREASGAAVGGPGAVGIESTLAHLSMGVEPMDATGATVERPEAVGIEPTLGETVEVFLFGIVKVPFFPLGCLAVLFSSQLLGSFTTFFPASLNLTSMEAKICLATVSTFLLWYSSLVSGRSVGGCAAVLATASSSALGSVRGGTGALITSASCSCSSSSEAESPSSRGAPRIHHYFQVC